MKRILTLLLTSALAGPVISRPESRVAMNFVFPHVAANYTCFRGSDSLTYVEVATQISHSKIKFLKTAAGYTGRYTIDVMIADAAGPVASRSYADTLRLADFEESISAQDYRLGLMSFLLKPGLYSCRVGLRDEESNREYYREMQMVVPSFADSGFRISQIELSRNIHIDSTQQGAFIKNGRFVEPNPSGAFGFFAGRMYLYYELYGLTVNADSASQFVNATYTFSTKTETVKSFTRRAANPGETSVHTAVLPIGDLAPGSYKLKVVVEQPATRQTVEASTDFIVGWDVMAAAEISYDEMIDQLQFIASEYELTCLQRLPLDKKRAGLLSFWLGRDPTPGTPENELMTEFYRRVSFANVNFAQLELPGWQSDQGRVYIQFGPPDKIRRAWVGRDHLPCEIWDYARAGEQFIFVDQAGYGKYQIVQNHSTVAE